MPHPLTQPAYLAGAELMNGSGVLAEGPQTGMRVYHHAGWAKMRDDQRLLFMQNMIEEYARDPRMAELVIKNVLQPARVEPHDHPAQAKAIQEWVRDRIYYTKEPGERLQSPWRTLDLGFGDCDDQTLLVGTFARAINLAFKPCLVGLGKDKTMRIWCPGMRAKLLKGVRWFHVLGMIGWPDDTGQIKWVSAETILKDAPLGYNPALNGVRVDGEGRPSVPVKTAKTAAAGAPSGQFLGNLGSFGSAAPEDAAPRFLSRAFAERLMVGSLEGAIQGVVTAVAIYYVMQAIQGGRK